MGKWVWDVQAAQHAAAQLRQSEADSGVHIAYEDPAAEPVAENSQAPPEIHVQLAESESPPAPPKAIGSERPFFSFSFDDFKMSRPKEAPPPNLDDQPGYSNIIPKRVTLSHVEGTKDAFEYGSNNTTLALMFAGNYRTGKILPFVDMRGHRFDNNLYAANFGIGGRYVPSEKENCEVFGFNAYYDYREGNLGQFNQVGLGAEILSRHVEFRANAYAPVGRQKIKQVCNYTYNGNYVATETQCELISYGFNAEIGFYIFPDTGFFLYPAVGIYYFSGNCIQHTKRGVEARIRPQYKDIIAVDLSIRHDSVFNTVYQAALILYLPLYQLNSKRIETPPCGITRRQVYQPVERFDVIPLAECDCWQTNF